MSKLDKASNRMRDRATKLRQWALDHATTPRAAESTLVATALEEVADLLAPKAKAKRRKAAKKAARKTAKKAAKQAVKQTKAAKKATNARAKAAKRMLMQDASVS